MNTTIHPNDLFAPFTPDPDGQSWALTTDADGNILPASHDGPGVAIWCIRIIGERTYAITRQVWDCPSKTVYRGRIWARWFFRLLMSNFEGAPKIEWGPKREPGEAGDRPAGSPVKLNKVLALLPSEGGISRAAWVALAKRQRIKKTTAYKCIQAACKSGLVVVTSDGLLSRSQ